MITYPPASVKSSYASLTASAETKQKSLEESLRKQSQDFATEKEALVRAIKIEQSTALEAAEAQRHLEIEGLRNEIHRLADEKKRLLDSLQSAHGGTADMLQVLREEIEAKHALTLHSLKATHDIAFGTMKQDLYRLTSKLSDSEQMSQQFKERCEAHEKTINFLTESINSSKSQLHALSKQHSENIEAMQNLHKIDIQHLNEQLEESLRDKASAEMALKNLQSERERALLVS
jgi:hypothetical protein